MVTHAYSLTQRELIYKHECYTSNIEQRLNTIIQIENKTKYVQEYITTPAALRAIPHCPVYAQPQGDPLNVWFMVDNAS